MEQYQPGDAQGRSYKTNLNGSQSLLQLCSVTLMALRKSIVC